MILKRVFDLTVSLLGVLVLSPIMLLITIALLFAHGKPFFFQSRPGKNESLIKIVKFRSMNDNRDQYGQLLSNKERLTKIGKFLRKTSLDEIPQLFNVIIGTMSLVGPRPLKIDYLALYSKEQKRRHNVRPGITGWAQVNGRNAITYTKKFEYDVWYVENWSFWLDIKIIYLTVLKLFKSEQIDESGVNPNIPFNGHN